MQEACQLTPAPLFAEKRGLKCSPFFPTERRGLGDELLDLHLLYMYGFTVLFEVDICPPYTITPFHLYTGDS